MTSWMGDVIMFSDLLRSPGRVNGYSRLHKGIRNGLLYACVTASVTSASP